MLLKLTTRKKRQEEAPPTFCLYCFSRDLEMDGPTAHCAECDRSTRTVDRDNYWNLSTGSRFLEVALKALSVFLIVVPVFQWSSGFSVPPLYALWAPLVWLSADRLTHRKLRLRLRWIWCAAFASVALFGLLLIVSPPSFGQAFEFWENQIDWGARFILRGVLGIVISLAVARAFDAWKRRLTEEQR